MDIITLDNHLSKMLEKQHLNEFLNVPVGLEPVAIIGDNKLYSSNSLKEDFLKSLYKYSSTKPSMNIISKLVSNDKITPCWTGSNLYKNIIAKVFPDKKSYLYGTFGIYVPYSKRIFVIMNESINSFGLSDEKQMAQTTLHETMHMSAHGSKAQFLKIWKDELDTYYSSFFMYLYDINSSQKSTVLKLSTKFYNDIYVLFEHLDPRKFKKNIKVGEAIDLIYDKYMKPLKEISGMKKSEFDIVLHNLKLFAKLFYMNFNALMDNYGQFKSIFIPMYLAYRDIGAVEIPRTTVCQELFYPSEVVSIHTAFPSVSKSNIKQSLSIIKI